MARKIETYIKLQVPAGKANPSPPVGPALGQHGVNIMEFCKAFNAQTQGMEVGIPVPVVISVYNDRSFTFIMKTPPATVLLKKAAGIDKGSGTPNTAKVGKVTRKQLEEIAKIKARDLNAADLDAAVKIIAGSARRLRSLERFSATWERDAIRFDGRLPEHGSCHAETRESRAGCADARGEVAFSDPVVVNS